jgi:GxxExxY protein
MNGDDVLEPLTGKILAAAFEVANTLGHGFLESVYQKALLHELTLAGLSAEREVPFKVGYKNLEIGTYVADLIVQGSVVLELKAIDALSPAHVGQCLNYLRASGLRVGLLLNFGRPRLEYRRVAL